MHNLAVNLSGRESGTADYALAAKWYLETAFYGLADSQFNLGILAEHGLGMPTDLPEAYKWFALAAISGDAEAAKRRKLIKLKLNPDSLGEAEKAVAAWTARTPSPDANEVPGTRGMGRNLLSQQCPARHPRADPPQPARLRRRHARRPNGGPHPRGDQELRAQRTAWKRRARRPCPRLPSSSA